MEAVPRLPMIKFDLKTSTESVSFAPQLKQYIASFYNEDPESYTTEINNLESLRGAAVRPTTDVSGCQLLKKYYCQLHFLKSRFPMGESQAAAVYFCWKDTYSSLPYKVPDINYELMCILYNIGALHSQLGASDSRTSPDGMKMACTHFQCAAWAFQTVKETYYQMVTYTSSMEIVHYMHLVCLAQAQECILEKSMMDNRKATIIAKVAVQVADYYRRSLMLLQSCGDESTFTDVVGSDTFKEWMKYLSFKVSYHKCIALLFQGQQAEEQQKMGERVAFYQAACEQLEEARKLGSNLKQKKEIAEALGFTSDVVEGKRKAAKNENEFIYHEEVPDKHALQEVKGASLVKGIPFNVNDVEVSGPDIFARLVPMEAHEASSLYSEKKAQMLRQLGELVESKDQALAEFMSSMQLDIFNHMRQATGISQDLVDRAAALSAKPTATQDLISSMSTLSNSYHEVESMLNEIQELLKEEEQNEKEYQEVMGKRPPSIIATDLSREAAKYKEAHGKANESNQNLHKAMTTHVANLKILAQPLKELQHQIPAVELPNPNIDENCIKEIDNLIAKVEEMRNQRAMLWTQFREAVHQDDITNVLVTRQPDQPLDQLFQQELQKHQQLASLIEQNAMAQENIISYFIDVYARSAPTRRFLQEIITKRNSTVTALITSYDTYDDLLSKANKGIEFYNKLETNVSKLLQRIKSACKVQQEERDQMLAKNSVPKEETTSVPSSAGAPKLKDYLDSRRKANINKAYIENNITPQQPQYYMPQNVPETWPPAVRPTPLGSDNINDTNVNKAGEDALYSLPQNQNPVQVQYQYPSYDVSKNQNYGYDQNVDQALAERMNSLRTASKIENYGHNYYPQQQYYVDYYPTSSHNYSAAMPNVNVASQAQTTNPNNTNTTNTYQTISSPLQNTQTSNYASISQNVSLPHTPTPAVVSTPQVAANYPNMAGHNNSNVSQNYETNVATSDPNYYYPNHYQNYDMNNYYNATNYNDPQQYNKNNYNQNEAIAGENYNYPTISSSTSEYATSVRPNITNNHNSTYSSPIVDMKSSNSESYPTGYENPLNAHQYPSTYNQMNYDAYSTYYNQQNYQNQNYPGTVYGYPVTNAAATSETSEVAASLPQSIYNYSTNVSTPQPVSTPGQVYNYQTTPQSASTVNEAYNYQPAPAPIYNYSQQPSPGSGTSYNYQNNANIPQAITSTPVQTKESNLDLLTGLDFTVNQAPLIPQQNPTPQPSIVSEERKPNKTESKTDPVVQKIERKPSDTTFVQQKDIVPVAVPSKLINFLSLDNEKVENLFVLEVEKFEKFVDVLNNKTLNGPTNLDLKWKEIQDKQDCDGQKRAISVARCYPMKNRFPDILPYDYTRVELRSTKDDYINASHIKDVSYYSPTFIVSQAPLGSTKTDFWTMIREQQVEIVICLLNDNEIGGEKYWPLAKGQDLSTGNLVISLMKETIKSHWVERLIQVTLPEMKDSKVVIHLQFTSWPGSLFPTSPEGFLNLITETIGLYQQQRNISHPVVVHCSSGIGRSGLFCLLMATILEVTNNSNTIPDLVSYTSKLTSSRKNILRDREHLKFAYESFLCYMKQIIARGRAKKNSPGQAMSSESEQKPAAIIETKVENDDPLSTLDPFWASKKGH